MEVFLPYLIVCPLLFLAGFVDSIAGGGGLVALPAYILAGIPPHMALGTNKFSSTLGTTMATIRFAGKGFIKFKLSFICIICALTGSSLGSRLAVNLSGETIEKLLLVVLPLVAFYVFRSKKLQNNSTEESTPGNKSMLIAALAALVIGAYDGFYGPGTGTFLLLILTGVANIGLRTATGLTKIINLSSNIAALTVFLMHGMVYFPLGIAGALFNILGNYVGSGMVLNNPGRIIRPVIILVLLLLALKLILQ